MYAYMCSLVSTHHSPTDVGSVLKLAMASNGSLFPVIAENIKVHSHVECISNDLPRIFIEDVMSFHWGCGIFPLWVWCLSIVIGHINKKEHEMACVDTCGAFVGAYWGHTVQW